MAENRIAEDRIAEDRPAIVIVGGGFGGIAAARALRRTRARVILIDRVNHHLFQPLLYQVATALLTPGQIAVPIREILRRQKNITVLLGDVTGIDRENRRVLLNLFEHHDVPLTYDYLILATGASHSYFGRDDFKAYAPGLKSLADAVSLRDRILCAFEQAEAEKDPARHRDLLTFVLVGGGPTGVEMAAAIRLLVNHMLKTDFRRINPAAARIILLDKGNEVLSAYSGQLPQKAKAHLERLGVEIRLGASVDQIDGDGVVVNGERIPSNAVIWTAGVEPSHAAKWLNAPADRAGRVRVSPDLSTPGSPEVFVIGDTASIDHKGKPLPGVAQVAIQQGEYVGKLIARRVAGKSVPPQFHYFDKGSLAVIGPWFAVFETGWIRTSGLLAWMIWAGIHLAYLARQSNRQSVLLQWMWAAATGQRGSRLILNRYWGKEKTASAEPNPSNLSRTK